MRSRWKEAGAGKQSDKSYTCRGIGRSRIEKVKMEGFIIGGDDE